VFTLKRKSGQDPKVEKLESENQRMKNVIAEITAENLDLKKALQQNLWVAGRCWGSAPDPGVF
jgi:hypothetical protein